MKIKVRINGSDVNRWHKMGLKANPFPQIAKAEYVALDNVLRALDADPIKSKDELIQRIEEANGPVYATYMREAKYQPWLEFVKFCVDHYVPGERTETELEIKI